MNCSTLLILFILHTLSGGAGTGNFFATNFGQKMPKDSVFGHEMYYYMVSLHITLKGS